MFPSVQLLILCPYLFLPSLIRPLLPLPDPVTSFQPISLCFSPPSSLSAACCRPQIHLKIGTITCPPVAPISPEAIRSTAVPVLSSYKTCSSYVNTANFRLRRFVDHFCSLIQPFTRSTFLIITLNKAANSFILFYLFHFSTLSESTHISQDSH